MREAIPPITRLAVTLRYLATTSSFKDLSYSSRIGHSTLTSIVYDTLNAIKTCLGNDIKMPSTPQEWIATAERFDLLWNFPHCVGALDGKHVTFHAPLTEKAYYRNYKCSESIVLLAIVDADYKFLFVNVGVNGRMNDAGVFRESGLPASLNNGSLNLPPPTPLRGRNIPVPYVSVADDAFPLSMNIMKPYGGRHGDLASRVHDYRLSRARRVVENAFGIMSNRFQVLLTAMNIAVDKVELVTLVCCILHNFVLMRRPVAINNNPNQRIEQNITPNMPGLNQQQGGNRHGVGPRDVRNEFREYFNGEGAVHWQREAVRDYRW